MHVGKIGGVAVVVVVVVVVFGFIVLMKSDGALAV